MIWSQNILGELKFYSTTIFKGKNVWQKWLKWVASFQNEWQIRKMCDNEWVSDKLTVQAKS